MTRTSYTRSRRGQQKFLAALLAAYRGCCAVTGGRKRTSIRGVSLDRLQTAIREHVNTQA